MYSSLSRSACLRQVKVRGVRVCLEEVESLACTAAGLPSGAFAVAYVPGTPDNDVDRFLTFYDKMAQVTTNAPDRGYLVGFFVPKKGRPDDTELARLKHRIAAEITAAQLPALLVPVVAGFPLTSTGKVKGRLLSYACIPSHLSNPEFGDDPTRPLMKQAYLRRQTPQALIRQNYKSDLWIYSVRWKF